MKKENKLYWRRLDNSAKIFPISAGKKYSTVFRFSVVLKEIINPVILKKAVIIALEKYQSFKVRMKSGLFWNYFEQNPKDPIIEEEKDYPCKYIDFKRNNNYLFKVTYFEQKINIDIFHSLTDGNSGNLFFKEIIYTYIELSHPKEFEEELRNVRKQEEYTTEDSYMKNYDKTAKSNASSKKAYTLKGDKIKLGAVSAIHEIIDVKGLKEICKKEDCTVTQYLSAVLIYSIYEENYKKNNGEKPIKLCIPVNLKKYFPASKTMSNFFSYITLEAEMKKDKLDTFDKILKFVKEDFQKRLTEEEIIKTMSANVRLGNNPFIKGVPLALKKAIVRLSYIEIRKYTTTTFSNVGRIGIIGKYQPYIEYFLMLIAPEPVEKIKCSACSFENKMVFTFTSILNDSNIEKRFYEFLIARGIKVEIESNGVLDVVSTKN
ncbi:MAG: hypothetical protein IKF38_05655 [Clostridia bacterium]|nr:hypothetical protein [Clostridia bacterium]